MTNKHTPAPWNVLHSKAFNKVSSFDIKQNDISEAEWNKKLIAAAPELLEILQRMAEKDFEFSEYECLLARQAIAKATQ
jgi:hypothetical protein